MTDQIRPFSCGGQYADWQSANCYRCQKSIEVLDPGGTMWPTCKVEAALVTAYCSDGMISLDIAARMGYDPQRYTWPCGEVEWTEKWKAEYLRRKAKQE